MEGTIDAEVTGRDFVVKFVKKMFVLRIDI